DQYGNTAGVVGHVISLKIVDMEWLPRSDSISASQGCLIRASPGAGQKVPFQNYSFVLKK
ncbi:MAG: hypothetical protein ACI83P_002296, partial [Janthinobacterium sp.]